MKRKDVINEKTSRFYINVSNMINELERDLKSYIEEHGELDFTNAENKIYTTFHMWGDTAACSVDYVRVKHGVLLVVDDKGDEHDRDDWTLDTLFDICYCTDCWPTEE